MRKKSRFDQTRRALSSRVIFQQARKVLLGSRHSATTRSSSSVRRSCEQLFAFRRPLAAFRVLSSSVSRSCNHEFAFRHHLAAFQPRVRVLPSSSSRVKVLQPRSHVSPSSASLAAFQTTSSNLRAAFRRRSQKMEPCSISYDRLRSSPINCDYAIIWKPKFGVLSHDSTLVCSDDCRNGLRYECVYYRSRKDFNDCDRLRSYGNQPLYQLIYG